MTLQFPRSLHQLFRCVCLFGGLIAFCLPGLLAIEARAESTPPVLHVVTDDNYPPYLFRNSAGIVEGYLVDYWQLWEKKTGVRVQLTATNWAEAQEMVKDGRAEVIDMIYRTPPREAILDFSRPYADLPVAIYNHSSITGINSVSTLKGFQVGVQAGDACIDELAEHDITNLVKYRNYAELIDAAMRQEIKVICMDEHPGNFYLYKAGAEDVFLKSFELYKGQFHRAVRKGQFETLKLVEQGMQAISKEEEAVLRKKWFGTPLDLVSYGRYLGWGMLAVVMLGGLLLIWNLTLRKQVAAKTTTLKHTLEDLQEAHRVTQEARENLSATLQAIPDLLFELDADGRYLDLFANQEALLASPKDDLLDKLVTDILPRDAARIVMASIATALADGKDFGRTISLDIDGRQCWFELSTTRKSTIGKSPTVLMLSRDITQRREAEQAVLGAVRDKHFRTLFEAAPVALSYVQGEEIRLINRRFTELFGYQHDEITNLDSWWKTAYPDPDYRQWVQATWQSAIDASEGTEGKLEDLEYRVTCKDGCERTMLIGGQLLDGGLMATFTDISPLRAAEKTLLEAKELADAANLAKSAFLANMSHEIRTPMNAILGYAHLLGKSPLQPDQLDRLHKIEGAGKHLLAIINDILDISKIESGKLVLDDVDFPLSAIVDHVQSLMSEAARAKGLTFEVDYGNVPSMLRGDSTRLRQALLNFASNAVKFTDHGKISLRARLVERNGKRLVVRFEVQDTGIGIPAESRNSLFQAFQQVDTSTTRKYGGTGLGLAISQRLAHLMGGETGVESEVGVGSTFWFTAQLQEGNEVMREEAPAPASPDSDIKRHHTGEPVLLVEDDPINQEVALELLRDTGLHVDVAENGQEAVAMATNTNYALILMDMQMPVMGGLEATTLIRKIPGRAWTPIIAMTANAFDENREQCIVAGMNDFIAKPVVPELLFQTLAKWLAIPRH